MQESKQHPKSSKTCKTLKEPCSTLNQEQEHARWLNEAFCGGYCDEVKEFDKLCAACKIEYDQFMKGN